ncbi:MAG: aldo/keto reductase, partial [Actinomycetota bacterium]|nr:aldo/keto reductase [Actinomycetota bacterium]
GLGCAALAGVYTSVTPANAAATVAQAAVDGIRYFDTAPRYGGGLSEQRLGDALHQLDRDEMVISTKVGHLLTPLAEGESGWELFPDAPARTHPDYSRDGVLRSLESSLERLQTDHVEVLWIHDPDVFSSFEQVMDETFPTLSQLRSEGVVRAIGVGINQWPLLVDFAEVDFDAFLLAGRYTLLDNDGAATGLFPICEERGISIVIGGPYSSGVLASGAVAGATFDYSIASEEVLGRVTAMAAVCERHGVPLPAAALQFSGAHPVVASVIPGCRDADEVRDAVAWSALEIPAELWSELKHEGLIDAHAFTPGMTESW